MTTLISIILYFFAAICAAVFATIDGKKDPSGMATWFIAFVVFFVLAVALHVFG